MDVFRENWPEIGLDLVSSFHADPLALLNDRVAELVVVSDWQCRIDAAYHPLFGFEIIGLMSCQHPLAEKAYLTPRNLAAETPVTYPVPDDNWTSSESFSNRAESSQNAVLLS